MSKSSRTIRPRFPMGVHGQPAGVANLWEGKPIKEGEADTTIHGTMDWDWFSEPLPAHSAQEPWCECIELVEVYELGMRRSSGGKKNPPSSRKGDTIK